jgi:cellulose synthase/poly-beta-1,6-N-acetylglucosamine synthase-like glycosyltransferase
MWQPDRGFRLSRSRNNAIRCAQGSIVVFADGDTWLSPGFLKEHADAHRACPALICGMRRTIHGGGREWKPSRQLLHEALHSPGVERQHLRQREALRTNQPWMACVGGNFSAPRSAQLQFDERFEGWGSEDRDLAFRLCKSGLRTRLLPAANAVHIGDPYAGFKSMDSQAVAGFLRSKATLRSKYPGGEMAESLELVRFCRRDAETDVWVISDRRQAESAQEILDEFQRWDARRDSEFGDKSCRLDELAVTAALVSGHRLVREF